MALAFQDIKTALAVSDTFTVDKPDGLAVGDLMIGGLSIRATGTITPPSGFTSIRNSNASTFQMQSFYKIADAGDVAAANFTFTTTASDRGYAFMIRITGQGSVPVPTSNGANGSGATMTCGGVTPSFANSMLLILNSNGGFGSNTPSVVTSNPSWTEKTNLSAATYAFACFSATRPEITGTGNATAGQLFGGNGEYVQQIICISPLIPNTTGFFNFFGR